MYKIDKKGHPILETEATVPYEVAIGPTWFRFFEEFKNEKIFGTRCPQCRRILVPARAFCANCFVRSDEWVEVPARGEITSWSLTNYRYFGMPTEPPFVSAEICLEGTDCQWYHMVGGFNLTDLDLVRRTLKIGTKVKAVWRKKKKGCIQDIKYFMPIALENK